MLLSTRTRKGLRFDAVRLKARIKSHLLRPPAAERLHLGCGKRRLVGWLNVDVAGSEYDLDLASPLPFRTTSFNVVLAQQVVEHLNLEDQLLPLLRECRRILKDGGEMWVSFPDMQKVCASYLKDGGVGLLEDRRSRWPEFSLGSCPPSQMANVVFHQAGEHVNLFDLRLIAWAFKEAGFASCVEQEEADLIAAYPEIPPRNDSGVAVLVRARA